MATTSGRGMSLSVDSAIVLGAGTALLYFVGRARDVAFCRYFGLPAEHFGLPPDALIAEGFRVVWGRCWGLLYLLPLLIPAIFYLYHHARSRAQKLVPRHPVITRALTLGIVSLIPVLGLVIMRSLTAAAQDDGRSAAKGWHDRPSSVVLYTNDGVELHAQGPPIRISTEYAALLLEPDSRRVAIVRHDDVRRFELHDEKKR